VIAPPRKGEPYPGPIPPVRDQWRRLRVHTRTALVVVPVVIVLVILVVNVTAGVTFAVLAIGAAAATVTYVKNRTDRHNAALERGEIRSVPDCHLRQVAGADIPADVLARLAALGYPADSLGPVSRFDGGWLARRRDRGVATVIGDDGGRALFDPRQVPDLWAAHEYLAGRGREPED
jgi:hypothetical protein